MRKWTPDSGILLFSARCCSSNPKRRRRRGSNHGAPTDTSTSLFSLPRSKVKTACVVQENFSWAVDANGKLASGGGTSAGDGNGFKLGGAASAGDAYEGGAPHKVTNSFAFENTACGFTRNNNTSTPVISSCGGRGDGKGEYCSLTNSSPVSFTITGAQAKALARNADGSLPEIN